LHSLSAVIEGISARHAEKRKFIEVRKRQARPHGKLCRAIFAAPACLAGFGASVMSLSVALNTAVSGLFANQTAIAATSENIANVNTPNFSRREARFQTDAIPNQFAGVDVEIVRAAADRFLQAASFGASATSARSSAIADALAAIEASLGAPGDNISFANRLDEAFAALTALGANPSSTVAKADALAALQEAFDAFARTGEAVAAEETAAQGRISADAARANALLEEIFRLNQAVSQSPGAADLIDQRLTELSTLLPIAVERGEDGRVSVSLPSGALLANSAGFNALTVAGGPPATVTLAGADVTAGLNGGSIGGQVALLNVELPRLATLIETTARGVADRLNAVYASNVGVGATAPSGAPLIVEAAGVFSVNAAILADPASFAIARPTSGSPGGLNDGAGAILLADIAATSEARAAGAAVAEIGARALNAERAAETDTLLSSELSSRAAASAGVNLDEELSNLILYQRAYSANARVIAAVDELWQSLLQNV
jgi:flagellar hook-associated protein 1 FlgK